MIINYNCYIATRFAGSWRSGAKDHQEKEN